MRISDYTSTIHYDKKLAEVRDKFIRNEVNVIEFKQTEWIDFGFPKEDVSMGETTEKIRNHMIDCHGMCWWLADNNLYYCSNTWSAKETGLC